MIDIQPVLALAKVEFDTIHAICDRALVPTTSEGEKLSAAQRVQVLELVLRQAREKVIGHALKGNLQ